MILAINTSTLQFGIALLEEDGRVTAEYFMSERKGHYGSLMPALDFLFSVSEFNIHSVKAVFVSKGPGSFTGLRVGLSAVKGLCHALGVPVIGVSSLEALAGQILESSFPVTAVLDSRRGELFAAQFVWRKNTLLRQTEDVCCKIEDFPSLFPNPGILIGNDYLNQALNIMRCFGDSISLAPVHYWNLRASSIGFAGLDRFRLNDFDDPNTLDPVYFRPPDIRPNPFASASDAFSGKKNMDIDKAG